MSGVNINKIDLEVIQTQTISTIPKDLTPEEKYFEVTNWIEKFVYFKLIFDSIIVKCSYNCSIDHLCSLLREYTSDVYSKFSRNENYLKKDQF